MPRHRLNNAGSQYTCSSPQLVSFNNTAFCPVNFSQRFIITSTYSSLISIPYSVLPVCSAAIKLLPLPKKLSRIIALSLEKSCIICAIKPTGFCVGCTLVLPSDLWSPFLAIPCHSHLYSFAPLSKEVHAISTSAKFTSPFSLSQITQNPTWRWWQKVSEIIAAKHYMVFRYVFCFHVVHTSRFCCVVAYNFSVFFCFS